MEARTFNLDRNPPKMTKAVRKKNREHSELPEVIVRFMSHMFGEGGYPVRRLNDREWCFTTTMAHYEIKIIGDDMAMVLAYRKKSKHCRVPYRKMTPTAAWRIMASD